MQLATWNVCFLHLFVPPWILCMNLIAYICAMPFSCITNSDLFVATFSPSRNINIRFGTGEVKTTSSLRFFPNLRFHVKGSSKKWIWLSGARAYSVRDHRPVWRPNFSLWGFGFLEAQAVTIAYISFNHKPVLFLHVKNHWNNSSPSLPENASLCSKFFQKNMVSHWVELKFSSPQDVEDSKTPGSSLPIMR